MSESLTGKTPESTGCCGSHAVPAAASASASADCCAPTTPTCCDTPDASAGWLRSIDWLMWGSAAAIAVSFVFHYLLPDSFASIAPAPVEDFVHTVVEMMNMMWLGIALGIVMVAALGKVPREFVMAAMGTGTGAAGMARAVGAGVLLDLCNHGILMVASRLYERGASTGQVIAFLVASPWNSFSLTLILIALVGLQWTIAYILLSMLVAMVTGLAFERLERRGTLPRNPNSAPPPENFAFWAEAKQGLSKINPTPSWFYNMMVDGAGASRMVLRWILFGVVLAGLIRAVTTPEQFGTYFGPTMMGLLLTMLAATVIEVCSEGSVPVAADIVTHANAPGNGFAFLMTGVATDYTEIMVLRETTGGWKVPLFLPLLTVPQVLVIAWLVNQV